MTPIRYIYLVLLLCFFADIRTMQAQCIANALETNVTCFGLNNGAIDLTADNGTAPYTYLWSNTQTTEDLSNLSAGIYICTVTDNIGCTTTASATLTEPAALTVDLGPNITLNCITTSGVVNVSIAGGVPPYSYFWINGETTSTISINQAGNYTLTVTDANNCTGVDNVTVQEDVVQPVSCIENSDILTCSMTSTVLDGSCSSVGPNFTYLWTTVLGNIVSGANTLNPLVNATGHYTLLVTNTMNGCTSTSQEIVLSDAGPIICCASPPPTFTCNIITIVLDGSCSSTGPTITYIWSGPSIISGQGTLFPTIDGPGVYTLEAVNNSNGCSSAFSVIVPQDIVAPTANAGPDLEIPCGGGSTALNGNGSSTGANVAYFWTGPNILAGGQTINPVVGPGIYTLSVVNTQNGCTASDQVEVFEVNSGFCSEILGRVLQDTLANCLSDPGEPSLSGWIVKAEGALGTFYGVTNANGDYQILVKPGDIYNISAVALSTLWIPCPLGQSIAVANPGESFSIGDLLFQKLAGCPLLTVDISSGNLRRCFSNNQFNVSYCNNGTEPAEDAFVDVTLDPLFTPVSSSIPYTDQGGGVLRFDLGNVAVGECGFFSFTALLSCDAVLGQTHCTEAHIYPDDPCIPPDIQWSGASLRISSQCQTDSVRFTIENVGTGNMPNALEYLVVEDQVMLMAAPVQLDAGESTIISVPANGSTWRLEVEQEPFHPGQSRPAVSVEGCTTAQSFSTGFVTIFPADDADEFVDIDCRENTGSYDPNDKQGFPKGYGASHYIRPGTPLEYQIRFQNTGNDTAFTVHIVDTLSAWLDPSTIRPGSSSHPYTWDLTGAGVLSFLFENILLPDSNVNEPASHGFVKFTIDHKADAPLETVIENTGEIYFDFNDAIVTNTTFHRLGENFVTVGLWQPEQPEYAVLVSPNPFSDAAVLEVKGLHSNALLHLQVFDLQGKLQLEMDSNNSIFQLNKGGLSTGVYLFNIGQAGKIVGTGKLIIQH